MAHELKSDKDVKAVIDNRAPEVDKVLEDIAEYVHNYEIKSDLAVSHGPEFARIQTEQFRTDVGHHCSMRLHDCV